MNVYIVDGLPRSRGRFLAAVQPTEDGAESEPPLTSFLLDWDEDRGPRLVELGLVAARLAEVEGAAIVVGRLGHVKVFDQSGPHDEAIEGPRTYGFLCDARSIGNAVYAAGMSRQVYRRGIDGRWTRFDAGVLDRSVDVDSVSGFRAIDGTSSGELCAVGYNGEIWVWRRDLWRQIDSPTNVILERVCVVRPDLTYAAGQGAVIVVGRGDEWEVLEHDATTDDFWGLEWFRERLYVSSRNAVFRLQAGDQLEPIDTGMDQSVKYSQLRASEGFLWSFGPSHILRSPDGEAWSLVEVQ